MRQAAWLTVALLWMGCVDTEDKDTDTDTDTDSGDSGATDTNTDGCPTGMRPTSDAGVDFLQLTVDFAPVYTQFDPDDIYDGEYAACVNDDGTQTRLIFLADGDPYGSITYSSENTGTFDLTSDDHGASIVLDLYGASSPSTWSSGEDVWTNGTWLIASTGNEFTMDINATGFLSDDGGHNLTVWGTFTAQP